MEMTDQIKGVISALPLYVSQSGSISGTGSQLSATEDVRKQLLIIFEKYNIKTVTDAPCGDFFWMKHVDLSKIDYIGYDVIEGMVNNNISNFKKPNINFQLLDVLNQLVRKSDLLICRDFLFHIGNSDICKILDNFRKSGCTYLLSTTFDYTTENLNKKSSDYSSRPINLKISPFNMGEPIYTFVETAPENRGRSMSLWKIT